MLSKMTLEEFGAELASDSPAPGGGSSAALLGSLASSLCSMMASLTVNKKGCEDAFEGAAKLVEKMKEKRNEFYKLMDEDASSFDSVIDALKMPKNTDEEKALRKEKIQEGYKAAIVPPIKSAHLASSLFDDIEYIVLNGNQNVVTDGLAAAISANSAVEMALLNVKINLTSIKDEAFVAEKKAEIEKLEREAKQRKDEIIAKVTF